MEYLINAAVIDRSVIHSFRLRWGKKGRVWSSRERATSCADVADHASFALEYLTKKNTESSFGIRQRETEN